MSIKSYISRSVKGYIAEWVGMILICFVLIPILFTLSFGINQIREYFTFGFSLFLLYIALRKLRFWMSVLEAINRFFNKLSKLIKF